MKKSQMRMLRYTCASVVAGVMGLGVASDAMALAGVNAPIFEGGNLFNDGPAKGMDENYISGDATVGNHYISPNAYLIGASGRSSGSLSGTNSGVATPTAFQQLGMTESIRIDNTDRGGDVSTGINGLGGRVKFSDGIQGINLPQTALLPSAGAAADSRAGITFPGAGAVILDPDNGDAPSTESHGARVGAVAFYSNNNPPGPNGDNINPLGSATGQLWNLNVNAPVAVSAPFEDDGLAPGSINETARGDATPIFDFLPFTAFANGAGDPLSPRTASFVIDFTDRGLLVGLGFIDDNGTPDDFTDDTDLVAGASSLLARYQLFDDTTTLTQPESPPYEEGNFDHNNGNSGQGSSTGGVTGGAIDDAVDGLLLLGGEITDASVTLTWRETGTGTGDFLWDVDFTATVVYDEGKLFDEDKLASPTGSISANWANIPFNLHSDGTFGAATPEGVLVDGSVVDVSGAAVNRVDAGGWDFLIEESPTTTDYDFDAYNAAVGNTARFPTNGSGSNDVTFDIKVAVPEPVSAGLSFMALSGLAGYATRRRRS